MAPPAAGALAPAPGQAAGWENRRAVGPRFCRQPRGLHTPPAPPWRFAALRPVVQVASFFLEAARLVLQVRSWAAGVGAAAAAAAAKRHPAR